MITSGKQLVGDILKSKFWENMEGKWIKCPLCSEERNHLNPKFNICVKCTETVRGMVIIAEKDPPKGEDKGYDNWGDPQVHLAPQYGKIGYVNVNSMNMETGERIKENVAVWENFEAVIEWGNPRSKITKEGKLFKIDFGDDDPLYAEDSLSAWKFYKSSVIKKAVVAQEEEDFKSTFKKKSYKRR